MNHNQIEKTNMYKKMLVFFASVVNSAIWAGFKRLADEITNFVELNAVLTNYMQQQQFDIKGITKAKNEAFLDMVNLLINKVQRAYVWALDAGNEHLQHIFDVPKSDFTSGPEVAAFNKIKNIRDAINNNIASMASVQLTDADITELNNAIANYENTIGTTSAAQARKVIGTKGIEDLIQPIDTSLDIIDKLIVSTYSESNADMVKEYLQNRAIDRLPTHHSGISVHVTDATTGADLEGVLFAVNGKSTTSDIDGLAEIIKIKPGTYNANISFKGYATQTSKIVIERGRIKKMDIGLSKAE